MSHLKKFYLMISAVFIALVFGLLAIEVFGYQKISDIESNVSEVLYRTDKINERTDILASLDNRYKATEANSAVINTALPDNKETSKLLSDLDSLAKASGLKLTLIQTSTAGKKPKVTADPSLLQTVKGKYGYELPLDVQLTGGFKAFTTFLKKVENYQRLININTIEINKPTNKESSVADYIEIKLKITAYLKK